MKSKFFGLFVSMIVTISGCYGFPGYTGTYTITYYAPDGCKTEWITNDLPWSSDNQCMFHDKEGNHITVNGSFIIKRVK
jgi:hypothetical protein